MAYGPAAAGGPGRKGPKGSHFKPYSARWRLEAHFLDPAGGPKFEVMPLVLTLFSCFEKIHFTPHPKTLKFQAKMIQYVYDQDTLEVGTK